MKKFKKFSALLLMLSVVFSAFSMSSSAVEMTEENCFAENEATAQVQSFKTNVRSPFFFAVVWSSPKFGSGIEGLVVAGSKVTAYGKNGGYCYIETKTGISGYIFNVWLIDQPQEDDLSLSFENMNIRTGAKRTDLKAKDFKGKGEIKWTVGDTNIISYDSKTHEMIGKNPGVTTVTATFGNNTKTCYVRCVYSWKKTWTTKESTAVNVELISGTDFKANGTIPANTRMEVLGDDGGDLGKVYVKYKKDNKDKWGYVKIKDISNKGTISQYNSLGWRWPVKNENIRYISSPYGWRDTNPMKHLGIDITGGSNYNIKEQDVVSAFSGEVFFLHTDDGTKKGCGNCIGIKSDIKDTVTGKNYVAYYMHLKESPENKFSDKQKITKGMVIGKVGSTGNSSGYHLHFEVNNKALDYYSSKNPNGVKRTFDNTINPIFFFMDYYVANNNSSTINQTSDAVRKYKGAFWYGDDESEKGN